MEGDSQARRSPDWSQSFASLWHAVHESNGWHQSCELSEHELGDLVIKPLTMSVGRVSRSHCSSQEHLIDDLHSYYVPSALQETVGLSHNLALVIGGAVQCMFFIGSLFPTFFLDRLGRRRPMMWGSLGLAISMMMLSILLSFSFMQDKYSESVQKATASASITFFFTYMLIFGATANCVPWVYVSDKKTLIKARLRSNTDRSLRFYHFMLVPRARLLAFQPTGCG